MSTKQKENEKVQIKKKKNLLYSRNCGGDFIKNVFRQISPEDKVFGMIEHRLDKERFFITQPDRLFSIYYKGMD